MMIIIKDSPLDGNNLSQAVLEILQPYFLQANRIGMEGYKLNSVVLDPDGNIGMNIEADDITDLESALNSTDILP